MNRKVKNDRFFQVRRQFQKWWRFLQRFTIVMSLIVTIWLFFTSITVFFASSKPVDAFFVLGGSIKREIYVAQLAEKYPQIPILISSGSLDPCIWLIFQRQAAPMSNVWLEKCADSTFDNFYYSIPILQNWGVHKVKLITSMTHLPRAKWIAQILLGAHGMWVEPDIIQEQGIPGNREHWLKTGLDVTRSLVWAGLSQIIKPQCSHVIQLNKVNLQEWQSRGFKCERQGNLKVTTF
ncbi:YdcF family protein [Plectonema cf. radiosum LEGE 06105]|uniref:YdcF family protein n=1 Tax=Plectonema cf. radiosum LEGE 06105 TaxID=945769 RepID=A0A8J7JTW0_9CYAN|nr:YdcF family protein [Plectonema radiosum]MBE9212740.1 YdcF family protein [Plectonema cf. radiosum LEGE 06105]